MTVLWESLNGRFQTPLPPPKKTIYPSSGAGVDVKNSVLMVECSGIPPGAEFTYQVDTTGHSGTYWIHAHSNVSRHRLKNPQPDQILDEMSFTLITLPLT